MSEFRTKQTEIWRGDFGKEYTNRNTLSLEMNAIFIANLPRNIGILEIGSNIGNQLLCLQGMGFKKGSVLGYGGCKNGFNVSKKKARRYYNQEAKDYIQMYRICNKI